jgi:hypothetical protein
MARDLADFRFDDPAGEVGVKTILWATDVGTGRQTPPTRCAERLVEGGGSSSGPASTLLSD